MYVVTVVFTVKSGNVDEFRTAMLNQARNSLEREPGCEVFEVCVDPEDARRTFLYEVYTDEEAFKAHLASAHFRDFDATVGPWVESKDVAIWQREAPAA